MNRFFIPFILASTASALCAQSFPIVPAGEPIYPGDIPELALFDWDSDLGALTRSGDLNNDGIQDLVVLFNGPGNLNIPVTKMLWLYPRNADGSFGAPEYITGFAFDGANEVQDFIIHDQNADGLNDLVFALDEARTLATWLQTPTGFTQAPNLNAHPPAIEGDFGRVTAIDLNQDGFDDYFIQLAMNSFDMWLNQTDGTFVYEHITRFVTGWTNLMEPAFIDYDLDNDLDLVVIEGPNFWLIENIDGDYQQRQQWFPKAANINIGMPATFADVNADGLTDIAFLAQSNTNGQDGIGFLIAPFDFGTQLNLPFTPFPQDLDQTDAWNILEINDWKEWISSPGDLDGDDTDEITLFPRYDKRKGWRITDPMNHNSRFGIAEAYSAHGAGDFDAADDGNNNDNYQYGYNLNYNDIFFDVNSDGVKDRVFPTPVHKHIRRNQEDPTAMGVMLAAVLSNPFDPTYLDDPRDNIIGPNRMNHLTHADINQNGQQELIITQNSQIYIANKEPDGYYEVNVATNFVQGDDGFRTLTASLDQDSTIDLVSWSIGSQSRFPAIYLNPEISQSGNDVNNIALNTDFNAMLGLQGITFSQDGSSFVLDDTDNDGDIDLILTGDIEETDGYTGYAIITWLNDSNANFSLGPISPITGYNGTNTQFIQTIDADNDGASDIACIAGNPTNQTIEIYTNNGSGNFTLQSTTLISDDNRMSPYWIDVQDIDNDGYEDVLVLLRRSRGDSEIVILYGSSTDLSSTPVYLTGDGAAEFIVADLDNNGLLDIASCAYQSLSDLRSSVTIFYQTATREFAPAISIDDLHFSGLDAFDINNDGALDIIATEYFDYHIRTFRSVPATCPPDLNLDKSIDFFDISLFIQLFVEQRPIADFNRDSVFSFFDISAFIESYNAGCDTP